MSVRVRFAPSPTGLLHVGALRTALYNHLFAQKNGGVNILRIEDTDRSRYNEESENEFVTTLKWVGIEFQEGPHLGGPHAPYRQSERKDQGIYQDLIAQLLEEGKAYKAFDTPDELNEMREYQRINKMPTGYFGGDWREASAEKLAEAEGKPYVIRLKIPRNEKIIFQDPIRGRTEWDSNVIDDPVLIKADGMPTYHFAAMVDDHLMGVTHVFRGEEWIPSLPKHLCLIQAFGWEPPVILHCPVIVGTDGKKLSKRHGATRVLDYAAQGFLPHPLQNFIALIGWSPGDDREAMSEAELIDAFQLDGIQPSPGRFDLEKLKWINGLAIRSLSSEELLKTVEDFLNFPYTASYYTTFNDLEDVEIEAKKTTWQHLQILAQSIQDNPEYVKTILTLEQERVSTLADFGAACSFFLVNEVEFDKASTDKAFSEQNSHVPAMFAHLIESFTNLDSISPETAESTIKDWAANNGIEKMGAIVMPIRVAMTGKLQGPGLFDLIAALGPDRVVNRLKRALEIFW